MLEASHVEGVTVRTLPELEARTIGLINRKGALSIPAVSALRDAIVTEANQRSATAVMI